ncbi:hypothetical protein ABPG75_006463 [Micractinium tetrahymenae]
MDAALEKLEVAQQRLAAAGQACPDLEHLLATMRGTQQAEELIPAEHAMTPNERGGGMAIPGLWAFVQAGALGLGSTGYFPASPRLSELVCTALGPYATLKRHPGGGKSLAIRTAADLGKLARPGQDLARQGFLGSLSVMQLLAASLFQQLSAPGVDAALEDSCDRIALVMRAVWGAPAITAAQRAMRQRLDRQQWVPAFPRSGRGQTPAGAPPQSPAAQKALREPCLVLRVQAGLDLEAPSKPRLQSLLCDAQALLDCCPNAAATVRCATAVVSAAQLAVTAGAWAGYDAAWRNALLGLFEEARARADAAEYRPLFLSHPAGWYVAPYSALMLASYCCQTAAALQSPGVRLRGVGALAAGEAGALLARGREAAVSVAGYEARLKPWLPVALQHVYAGWAAQAAELGGQAPTASWDEPGAGGSAGPAGGQSGVISSGRLYEV